MFMIVYCGETGIITKQIVRVVLLCLPDYNWQIPAALSGKVRVLQNMSLFIIGDTV